MHRKEVPVADRPPLLLSMQGINKHFLGVAALRDARLEVARGEVHALIGQNGAGKSTMIKVLTGVYTKDSGRIEFDGREVASLRRMGHSWPACRPSTRKSTWCLSGRWPRTCSSTGNPSASA
jgi:ABC-type Fe3+/spermidine/putrescine transport system ATPase subunit